jgi:hypothetical protein
MTAPPLRKVNVAEMNKGHATQLLGLVKQIEDLKSAVPPPIAIADSRLRPRIMRFSIFRRLIKLSCRIWKIYMVSNWRIRIRREKY